VVSYPWSAVFVCCCHSTSAYDPTSHMTVVAASFEAPCSQLASPLALPMDLRSGGSRLSPSLSSGSLSSDAGSAAASSASSVSSVSSTAPILARAAAEEEPYVGATSGACSSSSSAAAGADDDQFYPSRDASDNEVDLKQGGLLARLSVLTLNVWVKDARMRIKDQLDGIRRLDPDVICLQEVFDAGVLLQYGHAFPDYELVAFGKTCTSCAAVTLIMGMCLGAALVWVTVSMLLLLCSGTLRWEWLMLHPLAVLFAFLATRHHFFFVFLWGNKTGLAMLVRRSAIELDLDHKPCHVFSPLGHTEDFLNVLRPRGYILVPGKLTLRGRRRDSVSVSLMTTHLNQPIWQPRGVGRHRQVQELVDRLTEDACKGLVVVGCDLNATPPGTRGGTSCNTYRSITDHLSDAWLETHSNDLGKGLTWDQQENPLCISSLNKVFWGLKTLRWRCDYVFWRCAREPGFEDLSVSVRSCDMVFTGADAVSDHYGVHAIFEIRGAEGFGSTPSVLEDARRRPGLERERTSTNTEIPACEDAASSAIDGPRPQVLSASSEKLVSPHEVRIKVH